MHAHIHVSTCMTTHTRVAQQPHISSPRETTVARQPIGAWAPRYVLCLSFPQDLWALVWHRASRAGWNPARPRVWHGRHFPEPPAGNHQTIRQPDTAALPVPSQTGHQRAGSHHRSSIIPRLSSASLSSNTAKSSHRWSKHIPGDRDTPLLLDLGHTFHSPSARSILRLIPPSHPEGQSHHQLSAVP